MNFTDILLKKNILTKDKLEEISRQATEEFIPIDDLLKAYGVSEDDIVKAKAEAMGIEAKSIKGKKIPYEVLKKIPEEASRHYKFIPLNLEDGVLEIGMVNPDDIEAKEALQFISSRLNLPFKISLISQEDLNNSYKGYEGLSGEVTRVLGELETELDKVIKEKAPQLNLEEKFIEETPVTKIVAVMLKHAVAGGASDLHIEPLREKLRIRFRVDGILYTSLFLPLSVHEAIVSRIKILTNMKLDEKRMPQDGRFEAVIENREIDFRVSSLPTFFGEKIAIRVLDKEKGIKTFNELGMSKRDIDIIREAIKKPYGLILITGPTGSGKSTTLYAMLQELDREKKNIVSLEDPIEYNIEGINQSQVRPEIGYDFANGLRSILRQDPDMIMVGEIRDKETAALAIQAALTGHLVFSTLHTNTSTGVLTRLMDMGVDPYLIAPTFLLAIGQRLVRRFCADSKKEIPVTGKLKEKIHRLFMDIPQEVKKNLKIPEHIYQGLPTPSCPQGFRGRVGVYEIFSNSKEMERLIVSNPIEANIFDEARRQGMLTMKEDALIKLLDGEISIEEIDVI
ncbi:MAG: ATPase, T2SS/T4P/T4SS family [Patescibacteria group bacterium]